MDKNGCILGSSPCRFGSHPQSSPFTFAYCYASPTGPAAATDSEASRVLPAPRASVRGGCSRCERSALPPKGTRPGRHTPPHISFLSRLGAEGGPRRRPEARLSPRRRLRPATSCSPAAQPHLRADVRHEGRLGSLGPRAAANAARAQHNWPAPRTPSCATGARAGAGGRGRRPRRRGQLLPGGLRFVSRRRLSPHRPLPPRVVNPSHPSSGLFLPQPDRRRFYGRHLFIYLAEPPPAFYLWRRAPAPPSLSDHRVNAPSIKEIVSRCRPVPGLGMAAVAVTSRSPLLFVSQERGGKGGGGGRQTRTHSCLARMDSFIHQSTSNILHSVLIGGRSRRLETSGKFQEGSCCVCWSSHRGLSSFLRKHK